MSIEPTPIEKARRAEVLGSVLAAIREDRTIKLPVFDRHERGVGGRSPLLAISESCGEFSGSIGPYLYQFDGEEDLLHLFVIRRDADKLSVEEAQAVLAFLYPSLPKGLVWLKPGETSHHFYVGHDELLTYSES